MATLTASGNLRHQAGPAPLRATLLPLLLAFEAWLDRRRQRRALLSLSDHMLHDIGISRTEAEAEARRSLWLAG